MVDIYVDVNVQYNMTSLFSSQVSQARLEFWSDALSTAAAKRKDFEFGRSEAAKTSLEASQAGDVAVSCGKHDPAST